MQSASCKKVNGLVELEMTGLKQDAVQFEKDYLIWRILNVIWKRTSAKIRTTGMTMRSRP